MWISEERDQDRLDADDDAVPLVQDCNDRDPKVGPLVNATPVACNTVWCGTLGGLSEGQPWGACRLETPFADDCQVVDAEPTDVMDVTNCLHPLYADSLLQVTKFEQLHELEVDVPTTVRVRLELEGELNPFARIDADDHAVLIVNDGPVCERDTCTIGLPLATPDGMPGHVSRATFVASPGEQHFLVVSGTCGGYRLEIECDDVGAP
ncbi:MAG: hypothetical protein R3F61_12820 [Myxococcota bacterium]